MNPSLNVLRERLFNTLWFWKQINVQQENESNSQLCSCFLGKEIQILHRSEIGRNRGLLLSGERSEPCSQIVPTHDMLKALKMFLVSLQVLKIPIS